MKMNEGDSDTDGVNQEANEEDDEWERSWLAGEGRVAGEDQQKGDEEQHGGKSVLLPGER